MVEDTDRHGNVRLYYRRKGFPKVRLDGPVGSPAFWSSYQKANANKVSSAKATPANRRRGSLRWLCDCYFASHQFLSLDPRTQYVRRGILDKLCKEKGDARVSELRRRHVREMRDAKVSTPEAANGLLKALRQLFKFATESELVGDNPTRDIAYLRSSSQGHHSWTLEEVAQFESVHEVGSTARLALALLLYTGQRRSDVIRMGKQHRQDGWLKFTQFKGRNNKPVTLEIPIVGELENIISASTTGDLNFIVTAFGKPFSDAGFGNRFRKWCDEADLHHCSAHGLRKATAARLAELGCSEHEIMAITGHSTSKEVARYTRAARQKILAQSAMDKLIRG